MVVLFAVLLAIALASAVLVPLAQGQPVSWSNFVSSYDWLVAAFIIILVIALTLYATHQTLGYPEGRRERRRRRRGLDEPIVSAPGADTAVAIARERYARGEISSQQFDLILGELGDTPSPRTGR